MNKFIQFFSAMLLCTGSVTFLNASSTNEFSESTNLRILNLLPNLISILAVEPAIPEDFIIQSPESNKSIYEWDYWGPEGILNAYFRDNKSLNEAILRVKLSENVFQTGQNEFNNNTPILIADLSKMFSSDFTHTLSQWGMYPVLSVQGIVDGKKMFIAWVGLNDNSGSTLVFNLVYPEKDAHPNEEDLKVWNNFITKTTQLVDGDFLKAHGQDMQPGYTLVSVAGAKLKVLAEWREKDDKLQIVIIPQNPNTQFSVRDIKEGLMGYQWHLGEPIVKVYGTIDMKEGKTNNIIEHVTNVLIKKVSEFSLDKEQLKGDSIPNVFQKLDFG